MFGGVPGLPHRLVTRHLLSLLLVALVPAGLNVADGLRSASVVQAASQPTISPHGRLTHGFVPNAGQVESAVRYYGQLPGHSISFSRDEAVFTFVQETAAAARSESPSQPMALALRFLGANPDVRLEGQRAAIAKITYVIGNDPTKWVTGLPTYEEVVYRDLWPQIDLRFRTGAGRVKYEFLVRPGATIEGIRLAYRGAESVTLDAGGNLLIRTAVGTLTDTRPTSYQEIGGRQVPVESRFVLAPAGGGPDSYGFTVGAGYDARYPLIIDPGLIFSGFVGGSGGETGNAVALSPTGHVYITGETASTNFPTTGFGPRAPTDAFVAKFDATTGALLAAIYLGGRGADRGLGIAVDGGGSVYVTGTTQSRDFPTTAGAFDTGFNGTSDAFVTKLSATLGLVYSTYLGGGSTDTGYAIAVDRACASNCNAVVAGETHSSNFPVSKGALQQNSPGGLDAFVSVVNPTGTALVASTFLGGNDDDSARGVAVDGSAIYVTGQTRSANFPVLNALDASYNGNGDAFVIKLNLTLTGAFYSTFLGFAEADAGRAIAAGRGAGDAGSAYVTGAVTQSGNTNAFVAKLSPAGALGYFVTLGGSGTDRGFAIAVDSFGNASVAGDTRSPDFPTTAGALPAPPANACADATAGLDAFVVTLDPAGGVRYATRLGGSNCDVALGIAADDLGTVYVTGQTLSGDFPHTDPADGLEGPSDAFVVRLATGPNNPPVFDPIADRTVAEPAPIAITGVAPGPAFEADQTVILSALSSDTEMVDNLVITGTGSTRTLTYERPIHTQGSAGEVTITVVARDNGGTANGGVDHFQREFLIHLVPDNCPGVPNPDQSDQDHDGRGDLCDPTPQGDALAAGASAAITGLRLGSAFVTVTATFNPVDFTGPGGVPDGIPDCYSVIPPNLYNVILNGAVTIPEGPPLSVTLDPVQICSTSQTFTAVIDMAQWGITDLGGRTYDFNYVNFAKDPDLQPNGTCAAGAECKTIWIGTLPAGSITFVTGGTVVEKTTVSLHTVELASGFSTTVPLGGVHVRVFDRNSPAFQSGPAGGKNPSGSLYGQVYEAGAGLIVECTTAGSGICLVTETQIGDYLVLIKFVDPTNRKIVYEGAPKGLANFTDTNGDGVPDFAEMTFQIVRKNLNGQFDSYEGGSKTVIVDCGGTGQPACAY